MKDRCANKVTLSQSEGTPRVRDDRVNWYSACSGANQVDSEVMTEWWFSTREQRQV